MDILLISHDFSVTGAPNSLLRQAKYFRDAGHNVDVWSLDDGGLKQRYIEAGFNPIIVENSYGQIRRLYKRTNKKYDFIICNTTVTYKAVSVLQKYKTPLVWFIRETKLVDDGMRNEPKFAKVFKNFYNIYTVSEYAANVIKKYNKHVRVINNAIADNFTKPKKTSKKIVFGYIGSIIPIKGVDLLLDAFEKLITKNKNISLNIAGKAPAEMQNTHNSAGINWLGEVQLNEKQNFFDAIDVLVVPSIDDPCPLTVIEGAMYGKPIITTDTVGSNYMVQNGKNGFIVKTGDVNDLYKCMKHILSCDLDNMKQASRNMYLLYGTTERERKQVLKMLDDNLNKLPIIKTKRWYNFFVPKSDYIDLHEC